MIKAIETRYKGYRFRSRLEARWAVFFDAVGIEWEYEPEGFDLGDAGWYLPDFKVYSYDEQGNKFAMWIEVKGGNPEPKEINKCEKLYQGQSLAVALVKGLPFENPCMLWAEDTCDSGAGDWEGDAVIFWEKGQLVIGCNDPRTDRDRSIYMSSGCFENPVKASTYMELYVSQKARSARFEHGETPK
jgi:hypothetical protein